MKKLIFSVCLCISFSVYAETVNHLETKVFETSGSTQEIATKGKTCIAQILRGDSDASPITDADLQGGTIVARNQFNYSTGLQSWVIRSTVTFMAKEGRFKIVQDNIDRVIPQYGANPIYKGWGTGWEKAQTALTDKADEIAQCVLHASTRKNDW
ncbi:MAG: hypothetical protein NVS3B3_01220 [Aquirhabdus sp.]